MRFLALSRHVDHLNPLIEDKVGLLTACRDFINDKKKDGAVRNVYWTYAAEGTTAYWLLEVDSNEQIWQLLDSYPATNIIPLNWEVFPMVGGEFFFGNDEE